MRLAQALRAISGAAALAAAALLAGPAPAQDKVIKIGVIYDYTGPFAGGGSELHAWGTKAAIDMVNARGGVEGYKIEAIYADAQSKPDVAINEAERMLSLVGVDMLMGVFSSAQCVPLAAKVDAMKKFLWINTCISPAVLRNRNLKYVFRPQVHGGQFGEMSADMIAHYAKPKFGVEPKDLRVAIIHEDGPYGVGVAEGNAEGVKKHGMQLVLKEGYASTTPDLSALVTKLKRGRPDVILHTGYNPDITLFFRQAREQGLRFRALIGHGAGYGEVERMRAALGDDINYVFDVDPVASTLVDPGKFKPEIAQLVKDMEAAFKKAYPNASETSVHVSIGFGHAWVFLTDVLPRAIKKYGGVSADALRQAALETDIPEGGTTQVYGVKFNPPEHELAGQNNRAYPSIFQYVDGKSKIVWPLPVAGAEPVLPLPGSSPYALK